MADPFNMASLIGQIERAISSDGSTFRGFGEPVSEHTSRASGLPTVSGVKPDA